MKTRTVTVSEGEWLGDVPADWDFEAFYAKYLKTCGHPRDWFERSVQLYKDMAAAMKRGATVHATSSGGYTHRVYTCGLYDSWVYWQARPCFLYEGPIGPDKGEFYDLTLIRIEEPKEVNEIGNAE